MTFKTEIKKVKQEVVTECTCDRCRKNIRFPDFYGHPHCSTRMKTEGISGLILQHTGGFYSGYDNTTETLSLCDDCFFELVKEIKNEKR